MLKNIFSFKLLGCLALLGLFVASCEIEEVPDPNNLGFSEVLNEASAGEIQAVVNGIEHGMRERLGTYFDGSGVIGREWYRFSNSDPRFTSDLLGKGDAILDDNTFYTTNTFFERYRTIKNCNVLMEAIPNVSFTINPLEITATNGFAKTVMAYQLLLVLNHQYNNGVRVDVNDPDNLGPFLSLDGSLDAIAELLDEANMDLQAAKDVSFPFSLSSGFEGYDTPETMVPFNRAMAARVNLYRQDWQAVDDALRDSYFDLNGDLDISPFHPFSTAGGDLTNPVWFPPNAAGEARVAHPSYRADIDTVDFRFAKISRRNDTLLLDGLESIYDVSVYDGLSSSIPILRNEELILIHAESKAQQDQLQDAVTAINIIRNVHYPTNNYYAGDVTKDALIDEILTQRRWSLYGEGHRWVDMRRYNRLDQLPIDRPDDDVWVQFPRPQTEN